MTISFSLNSMQTQALQEGFDSLLDTFGKSCKLIYQPKIVDCEGCLNLAVSTYTGSNWGHGGPLRIDQSVCTMCGGTGKKTQEYSETITMSAFWTPKNSQFEVPFVNKPYSIIQTRGYTRDLPKVMKCIEMQLQVPMENYVIGRYKIMGEGFDQFGIIQDRYFIATWERL